MAKTESDTEQVLNKWQLFINPDLLLTSNNEKSQTYIKY